MNKLPKLALYWMIAMVSLFALIPLAILLNLLFNWQEASGDKVLAAIFLFFSTLEVIAIALALYVFRKQIIKFYYKAAGGE